MMGGGGAPAAVSRRVSAPRSALGWESGPWGGLTRMGGTDEDPRSRRPDHPSYSLECSETVSINFSNCDDKYAIKKFNQADLITHRKQFVLVNTSNELLRLEIQTSKHGNLNVLPPRPGGGAYVLYPRTGWWCVAPGSLAHPSAGAAIPAHSLRPGFPQSVARIPPATSHRWRRRWRGPSVSEPFQLLSSCVCQQGVKGTAEDGASEKSGWEKEAGEQLYARTESPRGLEETAAAGSGTAATGAGGRSMGGCDGDGAWARRPRGWRSPVGCACPP